MPLVCTEIDEYAKWLGLDPATDSDLLWIAREGLKAPLPDEWKPCRSPLGDLYYFNFTSGRSAWEHPSDSYYKWVLAGSALLPRSRHPAIILTPSSIEGGSRTVTNGGVWLLPVGSCCCRGTKA